MTTINETDDKKLIFTISLMGVHTFPGLFLSCSPFGLSLRRKGPGPLLQRIGLWVYWICGLGDTEEEGTKGSWEGMGYTR